MEELLVQKYLRSGKSLEDLNNDHGVVATYCNDKIGLNYDQLEAKDTDPLACECRGLILRDKTFDIVAFPMRRFFNLEQSSVAAKIDWRSASYFNKLDGTCIIVYFDFNQDKWCVATRKRPEADVNINDLKITFTELTNMACSHMFSLQNKDANSKNISIKDLMSSLENKNGQDLARNKTFVFELTSPYNRIVCNYEECLLTLLAVRDNKTLKEEDPESWTSSEFGLILPCKFEFNNVENMVEIVRTWNPREKEGVVVRDKYYNRVKVKNPAYIALNRASDSLKTSIRGCIELVMLGKEDDIIGFMPQLVQDRINKMKPLVAEVFSRTRKDYEEIKHIDDRKEFALVAVNKLWPAALFALKQGKTKDLHTFSLGNKLDVSKIPNSATDVMIALCKKVDPNVEL